MLAVLTHHTTTIRLAELGFLLLLVAGVWMVVGEVRRFKVPRTRIVVVGALLAVAGLLELLAVHGGTLG